MENLCWSSRKATHVLSDCNKTWIYRQIFSKNTQISNFMKIRPVVAELFHADRLRDMTKVKAPFAILRTRLNTWQKRMKTKF